MRLLFFTPHAALWSHTVPEMYLARCLRELGHDVSLLGCAKVQTYCAAMSAWGLAPAGEEARQRADICQECRAAAASIGDTLGLPSAMLDRWVTADDQRAADAAAAAAVAEGSLDTVHLGVPVGRIALYELTLARKKMSTDYSPEEWNEYRVYLRNAIVTLTGFARAFDERVPDVVIAFSPQYSNINAPAQYAIARGARVLFMESGTNISHRLGTMRVWDWARHRLVNPALTHWQGSSRHPATARAAQAVAGHFRQLLSGQHFAVFSSPYVKPQGDLRERWQISPGQRVVLMTLSSYDEAYAAYLIDAFPERKVFSDVFRTQAEWIAATVEWARSRPEIALVVRVHPRDFPNKREAVRSEQSYRLEAILTDLPPNVRVNWPHEDVSLYELLEEVDVIVTGWSVTAMEGLVLGIPVVTYDARLPSYPPDVMRTGRDEATYFSNIDQALAAGWSFDNVLNGFRWLAYNFVGCTVEVSARLSRAERADRSLGDRVIGRFKRRFPAVGRRLDLAHWRDAMAGAQQISKLIEQGADALPALAGVTLGEHPCADDEVVAQQLQVLYGLLYGGSCLSVEKPGLARSIRRFLASRGMHVQ